MDRWLNVGVTGRACWPTDETVISFGGQELILKPATSDSEQSIHINLRKISDLAALTLINRFLSVLSWCDDQAMQNDYGWSGNPVPVRVPLRSRAIGSSIAFPFYRELEEDPKARLALALFREAITANSLPYEFLGYFKILNVIWKDRFSEIGGRRINELIEGIRTSLPMLRSTTCIERLDVLSATHTDIADYLYKSGRCAVAHAYSDPIVDPDDVTDLRRLSSDLPIIKEIAENLIETEFKVSRSIIG